MKLPSIPITRSLSFAYSRVKKRKRVTQYCGKVNVFILTRFDFFLKIKRNDFVELANANRHQILVKGGVKYRKGE